MHALKRSIASLSLVAAVALSACRPSMPPSIKPTPPLVTDCLVVPAGQVTKPPVPPDPLTDEWAKRMWAWASDHLGLMKADRQQWQGERDCVRGKAGTGAVR